MLKKNSAKTLSAKLTFLMTAVVMATVIAMTIQSSSKFSSYILQNIEETSTSMAERTSADVAGIFEGWITQMTSATARLASTSLDENANDTDLATALKRDNDLLALSLYQVENGVPKLSRRALQPAANATSVSALKGRRKSPRAIMAALAIETAASPDVFKDDRIIRNVTSEAGAPTVLIAIKYSIGNQTNKFAVLILLASLTKIQVAMPQSRSTAGYIIDSTGAIFASTDDRTEVAGGVLKNNDLVKMALKRQSPSGFVSEFKDQNEHLKIGSFAQIPGRIPLIVIVERDREAVFQIITRMYVTAALWGALILLVALMASFISAGSVTKPLRDLVQATKRIAGGDFNTRLNPRTNDEVAELGHSVNNMASRIEHLLTAEVEKARLEKELETAKLVQSTFFPKSDIVSTNLSVTGSYQPATECGGDLWGHYHIREGVELVFIADAMGHGAPAALVTAIAYSCCKSVSSILAEKSPIDPSPGILLRRLNTIILDAVDGKISMTFFAAIFDFNTGTVTFANAGHNFPFVLTGDRNDHRLGSGKKRFPEGSPTAAITLTLMGNPLGVQRDSEYKEKQFAMAAGDKYILFTDGLIENTLNAQPPFSRRMLIETASGFGNEPIGVIKDNIFNTGYKIFGSENLQDDVTVVVAEVSPLWVKPGSQVVEKTMPPLPVIAIDPATVS